MAEVYALAAFTTSGGVVALDALDQEIIDDPTVIIQILGSTRAGGNVTVDFAAALDAPQKAALDAVVAAHPGVHLPDTNLLATEVTLGDARDRFADAKSALEDIRDTVGVRRIVDPLPVGANIVGKVGVDSAETGGIALEATLATRATEATAVTSDAKLSAIDGVLDSIKDTDGIKRIVDALPVGDNVVGRAKISSPNGIDVVATRTVDGEVRLAVTGKVEAVPPTTPSGGTEYVFAAGIEVPNDNVDPFELNNQSSPHTRDSTVVPNGKTLTLQWVNVGAQGDPSEDGSQVGFYWVENGNEHLITQYFVMGQSVISPLPEIQKAINGTLMVGDGSSTFLRVIRTRLSNSAQGVYGEIRGYYK